MMEISHLHEMQCIQKKVTERDSPIRNVESPIQNVKSFEMWILVALLCSLCCDNQPENLAAKQKELQIPANLKCGEACLGRRAPVRKAITPLCEILGPAQDLSCRHSYSISIQQCIHLSFSMCRLPCVVCTIWSGHQFWL